MWVLHLKERIYLLHILFGNLVLTTSEISIVNISLSASPNVYSLRVELYNLNSLSTIGLQVLWRETYSSSPFSVIPSDYLIAEVRSAILSFFTCNLIL